MKAKYRRFGINLKKNRPGLQACAVLPALNEARRIQEVVAYALVDSATAEIIGID